MNKLIHSVYKITNTSNGKVYIGVSKNLKSRWINHQNAVNYGSKLHEAIRNEGINNFDFFHLADCFTRKDAELFEKDLIKELNTRYPHGYNLTDGGGGTTGRKVSEKLLFTMRNNNPMKRPEILTFHLLKF